MTELLWVEEIAKALQSDDKNHNYKIGHRIIYATGETGYISVNLFLVKDDKGRTIKTFGVNQDVTELKKAEIQKEFDSNNLKALINNTNDLMWSVDRDFKLITCNVAFQKTVMLMSGKTIKSGNDILGSGFSEGQSDRFQKYYERAFLGESFTETEYTDNPFDFWAEISFYPIYNKEAIVGTACFSRDITERKKNEKTLEEKDQQLLSIYNTAADIIFVLEVEENERYRFSSVNNSFVTTTGIPSEMVLDKYVHEIVPQPSLNFALAKYKEAIKEKKIIRWEETSQYPTGTLTGEVSVAPVFDSAGNCIRLVGGVHDITERKKTEETLKQSENRFREFFENAPEAIVVLDLVTLKFIKTNKNASKIFKFSEEELREMGPADISPGFQPDGSSSAEKAKEYIGKAIKGERTTFEWVHCDADKKEIMCEVHLALLPGAGSPQIYAGIVDITERNESRKMLEQQFRELAASNTELEQFAYVTSHDLQEPLRMVSSFLQLLEKKYKGQLDDTAEQYINFAVDGASRMKALIQALLMYSRVGNKKEDFVSVDLNEVVQYSIKLIEEDIRKSHAVISVSVLPVIMANYSLISRLFINLITNAIKYRGDTKPEIEVGYSEDERSHTIYVKDNGIGIDPKFFDKIFIIFQRLHNKDEYSGTGIGLAICKKIAEIHKGKIWIESEEGKGSAFYFSIPKTKQTI